MNKEEKHSKKCPTCGKLTHKELKYCIFHAKAEEKTADDFKKKLKEHVKKIKKEDGDYDFKEFIFVGNINFKKDLDITTFNSANFWKATFKGDANFEEATFKRNANFEEVTFEEYANFGEVTFEEYANFGEVTFEEYANFREVTFEEYANFREATFKKYAYFWGATFKRNANFGKVTFKGDAYFWGATFERIADANFGEATFERDANFRKVTFEGDANFGEVTFKRYVYEGYTDFWKINFKRYAYEGFAYFGEVTFKRNANFGKATFEGYTYFEKATFEGDADFWMATFEKDADFGEAIFEGYADFWEATFEEDADFLVKYFSSGITFAKVNVIPGKKLKLKAKNSKGNISFECAYLENIYLELHLDANIFIDFTDTLIKNTKIERNQIKNHILQEKEKEFSKAKEIYLLIKNNFHSIGRYEDESWALKKEKDMERKSNCHFKSLHKWLWSCFLNAIYGYGEKPERVIVSAIAIIIIFAFVFMNFGIDANPQLDTIPKYNILKELFIGIRYGDLLVRLKDISLEQIKNCLYFSTVTFTTLGLGDFHPVKGWGRIFVGTEAFIGALMMALFVYTFARRTGGR